MPKKVLKVNYQPNEVLQMNESLLLEKFPRTTFVGEFALSTHDNACIRWYKQARPNRKLGHKDYVGFIIQGDGRLYVVGRNTRELKEERLRSGYHCLVCDSVTYSRYRHDYHSCKCGNCFVDGGPAYFRGGWKDPSRAVQVTIDLLKQEVVKTPTKRRRKAA